jgi:hypothetical protein
MLAGDDDCPKVDITKQEHVIEGFLITLYLSPFPLLVPSPFLHPTKARTRRVARSDEDCAERRLTDMLLTVVEDSHG